MLFRYREWIIRSYTHQIKSALVLVSNYGVTLWCAIQVWAFTGSSKLWCRSPRSDARPQSRWSSRFSGWSPAVTLPWRKSGAGSPLYRAWPPGDASRRRWTADGRPMSPSRRGSSRRWQLDGGSHHAVPAAALWSASAAAIAPTVGDESTTDGFHRTTTE